MTKRESDMKITFHKYTIKQFCNNARKTELVFYVLYS